MSKEEYFASLDRGLQNINEGKGKEYTLEELWIRIGLWVINFLYGDITVINEWKTTIASSIKDRKQSIRENRKGKPASNKRFGEIRGEVITHISVYPLTVGDSPNCVQSIPNFVKPPGRISLLRGGTTKQSWHGCLHLDCFASSQWRQLSRQCETPKIASNGRKMTREKCHSERSEESLQLAYLLLRCDS